MEEIKTKRLRIILMTDAEILDLVKQYENVVPELSEAYREMFNNCIKYPNEFVWYAPWKLCLAENEEIVGYASFKGFNNGYPEIGYGINGDRQGYGYATESVKALCDWALKMPGVFAIEAETESDNTKSERVLIKSGFIKTGDMGLEGPRYILK